MQLAWLSIAIAATVAYHLVLKATPATANPLLSLMFTYLLGSVMFAGVLILTTGGSFEWRQ